MAARRPPQPRAWQRRAPTCSAGQSLADPDARVEDRVQEVNYEVGEDDERRPDQSDRGDDGQVEVADGADGDLSQTWKREDALGDDRAAQEVGNVQAGRGHDGRQTGAQSVSYDDGPLWQALGTRGAHVVLTESL